MEMTGNDHIKRAALNRIAGGDSWQTAKRSKFLVGHNVVHVRYCGPSRSNNRLYKFNINPNTLRADYELWICGNADENYLIPRPIIKQMYDDAEAYVDTRHEGIRMISVDNENDTATYARNGKKPDLKPYSKISL